MENQQPNSGYAAGPRQAKIVELLEQEGFVTVRTLTERLGVSEMTVRRDLKLLGSIGQVQLVHGGAALTHGTLRTPTFVSRAGTHAQSKQAIAAEAVKRITHGDAIALDAGTTTYALAELLGSVKLSALITNSIPVIQLGLTRQYEGLVVLGGELAAESQALVGSLSVQSAKNLRATTLFLGAAAVDHRGVYVATGVERPTKIALMDLADHVVLLCDSSKFHQSAPVRLTGFEGIDVLITDALPPARVMEALDRDGVSLVLATAGTEGA